MKNSKVRKGIMMASSIFLGASLFLINTYEITPTLNYSKPINSPSQISINQEREEKLLIPLDHTPSRHAQKREGIKAPSTSNNQSDTRVSVKSPVQGGAPAKAAPEVSEELDLLARLIMAEAQGEPYDAKVAVGSVVMNRVESKEFPSNIHGVIYQNIEGYIQFTPVANGWINKPADSDCIKAAREAIGGVDATNGALFYYDTTTTNPWILEKKVSIQIGNMIYAY